MKMNTVWLVKNETATEVFDSETKARKRYEEVLTYLRNHTKPDSYNYWTYKEYMSVDEDDTHYAIFDAKNQYGDSRSFHISYGEYVVR